MHAVVVDSWSDFQKDVTISVNVHLGHKVIVVINVEECKVSLSRCGVIHQFCGI